MRAVGPAEFSGLIRFSKTAVEYGAAVERYGSTLEETLSRATQKSFVLVELSYRAIQAPPVWFASFSYRKSYATASLGDEPIDALLGALRLAEAHSSWIEANPRPSIHLGQDRESKQKIAPTKGKMLLELKDLFPEGF